MKKIDLFLTMAFVMSMMVGCTDVFDNEESNSPQWLGDNIYDYLKTRGDCDYYVKLIDDCNLTEVMQRTGSNTLFFTNDAAFNRYFEANAKAGKHPANYEEMSPTFKNMLISLGRISNAQLLERLCKGDVTGDVLRRNTYFGINDSIPQVLRTSLTEEFSGNKYFDELEGDTISLLRDASAVTLTQFFPDVMDNLGITASDLSFITNGKVASGEASLYGNKIVTKDITCKNGYLHELEDLIVPPETMAGFISTDSRTKRFASLMNRFAIPVVYNEPQGGKRAVYSLRYFNEHPQNSGNRTKLNLTGTLLVDNHGNNKSDACLYFDPGWNAYQSKATNTNSSEPPYQTDMGVMFVPTNEAIDEYFSPTGGGADLYNSFGSWGNVPDNIVADIVKNHQKYSFLSALPHDFAITKDEAGYDMGVTESDIIDKYVARNGVVYIVNKVLPPLDYRSVMGPAKTDLKNKIFNIALNDSHTQFMYYLRSLLSTYEYFITPDECLKHYVDPVSMAKTTAKHAYWNFRLNASNEIVATAYNLETGDSIEEITNAGIIKNRMNDIMRTHTIVVSSPEDFQKAVEGGQEYFVTVGYTPIRLTGMNANATVKGEGNTAAITITQANDKTNGRSYIINGIIQNTTTSTYQNLNQSPNSSLVNADSPFYEFLRLCNACSIFSNSATASIIPMDRYITFLQQYGYTIYVPTNDLLKQAQQKHYIPTPEELQDLYEQSAGGQETHIDSLYQIAVDKLRRFIRYHIQDNGIYLRGEKVTNKAYLTETIDLRTSLFYPVYVTNTGNSITVKDNIGNTANVSTASGLSNLIGRDIRVNNASGSTSNPQPDNSTTLESYTSTVVHQIDNVLWYEKPSSQWHTDLYNDLKHYQEQ